MICEKKREEFEASDSRLRKNSEAPSQVSSKKEKGRGLKKALKDTDDEKNSKKINPRNLRIHNREREKKTSSKKNIFRFYVHFFREYIPLNLHYKCFFAAQHPKNDGLE